VAIETGTKAAEVFLNFGFSSSALTNYTNHFKPLQDDYLYGKLFRTLALFSIRSGFINEVIKIAKESDRTMDVFYMAVSGEGKYREILKKLLDMKEIIKLLYNFVKFLLKKLL